MTKPKFHCYMELFRSTGHHLWSHGPIPRTAVKEVCRIRYGLLVGCCASILFVPITCFYERMLSRLFYRFQRCRKALLEKVLLLYPALHLSISGNPLKYPCHIFLVSAFFHSFFFSLIRKWDFQRGETQREIFHPLVQPASGHDGTRNGRGVEHVVTSTHIGSQHMQGKNSSH